MRAIFHFLVYLVLGIWIGSLVFFAAVLAPVAFERLPGLFSNYAQGASAAGMMVGASLDRMHWMGIALGILFLILMVIGREHYRTIIPQVILVLIMLGITSYSQFSVIPRMDTARVSVGGNIQLVPQNNPGREIFENLHRLSEYLEAGVLAGGVLALLATTFLRRESDRMTRDVTEDHTSVPAGGNI